MAEIKNEQITKLNEVLSALGKKVEEDSNQLSKLVGFLQEDAKDKKRSRALKAKQENSTSGDGGQPQQNNQQTISGGMKSGFGAGLGKMLGAGLGIAGLGAGIAGFMGALAIGDKGLDWLKADYTGLESAMIGFNKSVAALEPKSIAVLAGLVGISAFAKDPKKIALNMTGIGAGIVGLLGGLGLGSKLLGPMVNWKDENFSGLSSTFAGFSSSIDSLSPKAVVALGGLVAAGVGLSTFQIKAQDIALNMSAIGAGIVGLLGGLVIGGELVAGVDKIASSLGGGAGTKTMFSLFGESVDALSPNSIAALGALTAAGVGVSVFKATKPLEIVATMSAIGAGIVGLLGGLVIGGEAISAAQSLFGSGGDGIVTAFKLFDSSISQLQSGESITALAAILGVGVAASSLRSTSATGIFAVMTGIGAGIAGFMAGLTAGDVGIGWINEMSSGNSGGLVASFQMFNESIGVLSKTSLEAFAAILGIGSLVGALTGAAGGATAVLAGAGIFAVMTSLGAGIAGFMGGLAVGDVLTSAINKFGGTGTDGIVRVFRMFNDSIVSISDEAVEKLITLSNVQLGDQLSNLAGGIKDFFLIDIKGDVFDRAAGFFTRIFGGDVEEENLITKMLDAIKPLEQFDDSGIKRFSSSLDGLTASFQNMASVEVGDAFVANIDKMVRNVAKVMSYMTGENNILTGGVWDDPSRMGGSSDNIDFGVGLNNLTTESVERLKSGISSIYDAFSVDEQAAAIIQQSTNEYTKALSGANLQATIRPEDMNALAAIVAAAIQAGAGGGNNTNVGGSTTTTNVTNVFRGAPSDALNAGPR